MLLLPCIKDVVAAQELAASKSDMSGLAAAFRARGFIYSHESAVPEPTKKSLRCDDPVSIFGDTIVQGKKCLMINLNSYFLRTHTYLSNFKVYCSFQIDSLADML